jgi:glycosyltransferase involved in cell wall biosynthesis
VAAVKGERRPRVLVVANDRDAFLRHRLAVVEKLTELGCEVTVVAGGDPTQPAGRRGWRYLHTPIDRLSISPAGNWTFYRRIAAIIDAEQPDIVHLVTLKPAVFAGIAAVRRARRGGSPRRILITIPGLGRLMAPGGRGAGWLSAPVRYLVGRAIRWLSAQPHVHFVFETPGDRDHWLNRGLIRADNSTVVNGAGVDPGRFHPPAGRTSGDKPRFLFASRLLRSKGLQEFVESARHFAGRAEFLVAGWGDPDDADDYPVRELVAEPAIAFLGSVEDMPSLLRSVDVVCLPTRYGEGIPRILIEAAASGLASIASNQSGTRAIVQDGVSGILLHAHDAAAMGAELHVAVGRYIDTPGLARLHGEAALEHFRQGGFSEDAIVNRFIGLLRVSV